MSRLTQIIENSTIPPHTTITVPILIYPNNKNEIANLKYKAKSTRKYDQLKYALRSFSTDTPANNLLEIIKEITYFRDFWNSQFPEKKKPKKYVFNTAKFISSTTENYKSIVNLEHTQIFYDVLRRIERIIKQKLILDPNSKTLVPAKNYQKVVTIDINRKPIITFVHKDLLEDYVKIKNSYYHKHCLQLIYITEDKKKHDVVKIWTKEKFNKCPNCEFLYKPNINLIYNTAVDKKLCLSCNIEQNKYKQPVWTVSNIHINDYHSQRQGFKFIICKNKHENSMPIGMELETEFLIKKYKTTKAQLAFTLWTALNKKDIVFERDGSLNAAGMEIITNPMTPEYARVYWEQGKLALKNLTNGIFSGTTEDNQCDNVTNYWGIHLTTERKHWTDSSLIKLFKFLHNPENSNFLQIIAQRTHNYGGYKIGSPVNSLNNKPFTILKTKETENGEKVFTGIRNTSINLTKKQFIEFRMFQSTNETDEILKNYDFVSALHAWLTKDLIGNNLTHTEFLNWLNTPEHIKKYKYLIKYLQKPYFLIRDPVNAQIANIKSTITIFKDIDISKYWKKETITCA